MRKSMILLLVLIVSILAPARAGIGFGDGGRVPEPRMVRPTSEIIDLTGKDTLEFKWLTNPPAHAPRQFYDFRIYKGYQMVQGTLLYKENLSPHAYNVILKSDMFENGQVYTWALRNIFGAGKSDWVHVSFKVTKK